MAIEVGIRPRARIDVVELAVYIGRDNVEAAVQLMDAAEDTYSLLANYPKSGGILRVQNESLRGLRAIPINGYPNHIVYYLATKQHIEIIRVLHGARDLDAALVED